jgi:hypothetical protein
MAKIEPDTIYLKNKRLPDFAKRAFTLAEYRL